MMKICSQTNKSVHEEYWMEKNRGVREIGFYSLVGCIGTIGYLGCVCLFADCSNPSNDASGAKSGCHLL